MHNVRDFKMILDSKDSGVSKDIARSKIYETWETNVVCNYVQKDSVVLDIGAHIGYYTLMLSKLVGAGGKVISFEPSPRNFDFLTQNLELNNVSNVVSENMAVSDSNKAGSLYLSPHNTGDNWIHTTEGNEREEVATTIVTVDEYLKDSEYKDKIRFVKIDTQGNDFLVLKGMQEVLNNNDLALLIEFWPNGMARCGYTAHDLLSFLNANGFTPYLKNEEFDIRVLHKISYVNLFCKRN